MSCLRRLVDINIFCIQGTVAMNDTKTQKMTFIGMVANGKTGFLIL